MQPLHQLVLLFKKKLCLKAVDIAKGNKNEAAKLLHISLSALYRYLDYDREA